MSSKANKPEPFGYFRAQSWGWEDCAATDEGARALYDADAIRTQAARIAELEAAAVECEKYDSLRIDGAGETIRDLKDKP